MLVDFLSELLVICPFAVQLTTLKKEMMDLNVHGMTIYICSQSYSSLVANVHTIHWGSLLVYIPLSLLHLALPFPVLCVLTLDVIGGVVEILLTCLLLNIEVL